MRLTSRSSRALASRPTAGQRRPGWHAFLCRHALIAGLVLMFAFTWPIDLANAGLMPFPVPFVVYLFLGWGFIAAALLMTGLTLGRAAVITLLKRYLIWRVSWRWYLVAFLLYPAIFVASIALNAAWTGTPPDFSTTFAQQFFAGAARLPLFVLPFFLIDALANGEEMGWRGYVLPRLQARHSALVASLIVGVIWGFWHLPKFLGPAGGSDFGLFVVKAMGDAVLYTWLYNNTRGSLLLVTMLHAASNTAGFFLPVGNSGATDSAGTQLITVALIWLVVALVTALAGPAQLSRTEPRQVQAEQM